MTKAKTVLLALILATVAQAQEWKPPEPQRYEVENEEVRVTVTESVRDINGKVFIRAMVVRYRVPTSDLAEDRKTVMLLGADLESIARVDAAVYVGQSSEESPEFQFAKVKFYAGDVLVATKDIDGADDPYNAKGRKIHDRARILYDKEQKKKPGGK